LLFERKWEWLYIIIETKQLIISEELKRKIEFICRFANVDYTLTNGNIKSIKNTNIAYVKPHTNIIESNYRTNFIKNLTI